LLPNKEKGSKEVRYMEVNLKNVARVLEMLVASDEGMRERKEKSGRKRARL